MANDQVDFDLWLRSKFDGDALKAAQSEFRRTQKSAEDAGGDDSVSWRDLWGFRGGDPITEEQR